MNKSLIALALIFSGWPTLTLAAGITMTPGKIEVEVRPGQSINRSIKVTNTGDKVAEYEALVANMPEEKDGRFDLSRYINVAEKSFKLGAGENKTLNFTISLPANVPIQSYHGAIFIQTKAQTGVANGFIRVGSLIFVRADGSRQELGRLNKFSVLGGPLVYQGSTLTGVLSFSNQGNTYLNPYGLITINNWRNKELGYAKINPWYVLPGQSKIHELNLKNPGVGVYQLKLTLNRGYNNVLDERSTYIIVWSWPMMAIILTLIVALIGLLIRRSVKRKMRVL